jgi:penicillin amidase
VEPVNNVVVADRSGAVLYRVAGRVPLRPEANRHGIVAAGDPAAAWTGWVDPLPREKAEVVVSANERRGPSSHLIGTAFAPSHRADRIRELLADRRDLTAADCAAIHADTRAPYLPVVRALLESLPPHPRRDVLLAWDGHMDTGSTGAAAYAGWRAALVTRLAAEPVFEGLATPAVDDPVLLPALDLRARVAAGLESLLAADTPFGIDVRGHAAAALDEAETGGAWGDRHPLTPLHAFDVYGDLPSPEVPRRGVPGDADCVCCTGGPGSDDAWRGSVARYVWDLADPAGGGWVVPLGASADPRSPHHLDQLDPWLEVRLLPLVRDWDRLTRE